MTIRVRRVHWWTDWTQNVRWALADLWLAMFGCQHRWETIRFMHVYVGRPGEYATLQVNYCAKCRRYQPSGRWWKPGVWS
jgi:hypothetical protein